MAAVTDSNRSNISTSLPKKAALKSSPEIDARALMWTFDSSGKDQELECFFSGLTGFHGSKLLKEPLHYLIDRQKPRLLEAVITLWDRSFLFNVLPDQVKFQRASICAGVVDLVVFPGAFPCISSRLVSGIGQCNLRKLCVFRQTLGSISRRRYACRAGPIFYCYRRVQRHDDSWFTLASNKLGIPESVLRDYATHGHNLSFAILIYITRQQFTHIRNPSWLPFSISRVLRAASKFNVQDTSPELQHEFCVL